MKPCIADCAMCGSANIYRRHARVGDSWRMDGAYTASEKEPWASEFLEFHEHRVFVKRECVAHHCRECGYDWETDTWRKQSAGLILSHQSPTSFELNLQSPTRPTVPPKKDGEFCGHVCNQRVHLRMTDDSLIVDLDSGGNTSAELAGPRLFINRAMDDHDRTGWRFLVHPDDGDPTHCVFIPDGGKVKVWTDKQQETHWPGSV